MPSWKLRNPIPQTKSAIDCALVRLTEKVEQFGAVFFGQELKSWKTYWSTQKPGEKIQKRQDNQKAVHFHCIPKYRNRQAKKP